MNKLSLTICILLSSICYNALLVTSCKMNHEYVGGMNLKAVQSALEVFLEKNRDVIVLDAPFIFQEDSFKGVTKSIGDARWILGSWIITGRPESLQATVQKRFGRSEWESEVIDVTLKLKDNKYIVVTWRAYRTFGRET